MTITQIEENIKNLLNDFNKESFLFDFLLAYGEPKATIARLKKSDLNQLKSKNELLHRKKLFFKVVESNLHLVIDTLKNKMLTTKQKTRFIMVTNFKTLLAYDTKTTDTLDIAFAELSKHYDFFLPLVGMEKAQYQDENIADVKASQKLAKLYDEILKENQTENSEEVHALNIFLTRLLFCYFAEDTNIFEDNQFTNAIESHTQDDGNGVDIYLTRLFEVLNTQKRDDTLPNYLKAFPYVNGGLFASSYPVPKFTRKSRAILIEIGNLGWQDINPDIFGSMIQAVITPKHRGGMGMHYTSVPNIMKVMQPLFLDELYEEFEKVKLNKRKLQTLIVRIANLKIFDPACGSGNFLIIAYKELRKLEMQILQQIDILAKQGSFVFSEIRLAQFYGIELDDFAHEVAKLSLWLAEHQMNLEFFKEFGRTAPSLPLQDGGNIVHGNATRLDWEEVCPKEEGDEIYILGNPPYLGYNKQNTIQKEDMKIVFKNYKNYKKLDYISCWFYKSSLYIINSNSRFALVSTNSITQGEQVNLLWSLLFNINIEIYFAYTSFKWNNSAKSNAAVTVVIIGVRNILQDIKYLYTLNNIIKAKNINPYLAIGNNIIITKRTKPLSNFPIMMKGSQPTDGGNLLLTTEEKDSLLNEDENLKSIIKRYYGAKEYIHGEEKYCLWILDNPIKDFSKNLTINNRLKKVTEMRLLSSKKSTNKLASLAYKFGENRYKNKDFIIVPTITSERRQYIPCGFLDKHNVASNTVQIIYDYEIYLFAIVSSRMQTIWVKAVGGKFKTDYIFSSSICYNTFPFPTITKKQKDELTEHTFSVLDEREKHSEKTLAQLYDPNKMPKGLKEAHHQLDLCIERCYRSKPFTSDEERLEYLFGLYERMVAKEESGKLK